MVHIRELLGYFVHIKDLVAGKGDVGIYVITEILTYPVAPAQRDFVTVIVYLTYIEVRQRGCDNVRSRFWRNKNPRAVFDKIVESCRQAAVEELKIDTVVLFLRSFPSHFRITHT